MNTVLNRRHDVDAIKRAHPLAPVEIIRPAEQHPHGGRDDERPDGHRQRPRGSLGDTAAQTSAARALQPVGGRDGGA